MQHQQKTTWRIDCLQVACRSIQKYLFGIWTRVRNPRFDLTPWADLKQICLINQFLDTLTNMETYRPQNSNVCIEIHVESDCLVEKSCLLIICVQTELCKKSILYKINFDSSVGFIKVEFGRIQIVINVTRLYQCLLGFCSGEGPPGTPTPSVCLVPSRPSVPRGGASFAPSAPIPLQRIKIRQVNKEQHFVCFLIWTLFQLSVVNSFVHV